MSLKEIYNNLINITEDLNIKSGMNEQILYSEIITPNSKIFLDSGFEMGLKLKLDKESMHEILDKFENYWNNSDPKYKNSLQFLAHSVSLVIKSFLGQNGTSYNRLKTYFNSSDESVHLSDLKGKNIGLCIERAAIAHQIITVLGAAGITNYKSIFTTSDLEIKDEKNDFGAHAFIILENKNNESERYLFDVQNPVRVTKGEEKYILDGIFDLRDDEYESFLNKDVITPKCTYENYGYKLDEPERIYGLKFGKLFI